MAETELPFERLALCWPSMSEEEMVRRIEAGGNLHDGDTVYRRLREPRLPHTEERTERCQC